MNEVFKQISAELSQQYVLELLPDVTPDERGGILGTFLAGQLTINMTIQPERVLCS